MADRPRHLLSVALLFLPAAIILAAPEYPETIAVMQTVLKGELLAHAKYVAYAGVARTEKYPHIAYLAVALAASESIHARNFQC